MHYLLDTNICIYLINKKSEKVLRKLETKKPFSVSISAVSVAELEFGIAKSLHLEKNKMALTEFLASFSIIPFTDLDAEPYGLVRAYLSRKGMPIGAYDLQIAAQCLSRNLILVTNNTKEFDRIPNLRLENWV